MKRIILCLMSLVILFSGCTAAEAPVKEEPEQEKYVKAIWLPYYDLQKFTKDNNESKFTSMIDNAFSELFKMGFNTVTVQVRPCADAFYESKIFPSSVYCFDKQGAPLAYDPLLIMSDIAQKYSLKLEAWINPYRVSQNNEVNELCDENIAKKWIKEKSSNVYIADKIYFNPASDEVTKLIAEGVKEIVENYNISAIHFDDYFYPTDSKKIDSKEYKKYKEKGGKLKLSDWRRENVNNMLKTVYKTVKGANNSVRFGISPASDIDKDYSELYADVEKWASKEGFCDYICPQVYFGFKNVYQPFMFTVKKWYYITDCDLYIGLPLYKAGKADKYAAKKDKSIINEFKNNDNIIERQINYLSKIEGIKGFYVFSYGCLKEEHCKKEVENMLKVLQDSSPAQNQLP